MPSSMDYKPGIALYKFTHFNGWLSSSYPKDFLFFKKLCLEYFSKQASLRIGLVNSEDPQDNRFFDIETCLIPRYYYLNYESGIQSMQYQLCNPVEKLTPLGILIDASNAFIHFTFKNGTKMMMDIHFRAVLDFNFAFETLQTQARSNQEYIPRHFLADPYLLNEPCILNEFGITEKLMRCLEMTEVVSTMSDLMLHSQGPYGSSKGPRDTLKLFAQHFIKYVQRVNSMHSSNGATTSNVNSSSASSSPLNTPLHTPVLNHSSSNSSKKLKTI